MPATLTAATPAASAVKEPRVVELCRGSAHAARLRPLVLPPRR